MGNRIETSLSNCTFGDVTAWRAIRNADKNSTQKESFLDQTPISKSEGMQTIQSQANKITELNGQLSVLWRQKQTGEISPKEYRTLQQELASKLHDAERQRGHKPIRTK